MKSLLLTIGAFSAVTVTLLWGTFYYLDVYTRKGETVSVPDLIGKTETELPTLLKDRFTYKVSDSIYDREKPKGIILDQDPKPLEEVKIGRTLLLTLNRKQTPIVALPNVKDKSISQGLSSLQTAGFIIGKIDTIEDEFPIVLEVKYKQKRVSSDVSLPDGSLIDLVVGSGK